MTHDDEKLSDEERSILDRHNSISIRKHGVGLERVQRIHLDIDSEPMNFSELTIADMVQDIADRTFEEDAFTLHAIARALRGLDDHHLLILKQKKRGKWKTPTESDAQYNREMSWLYTLAAWEREGMKTEAAIAQIAERASVSRATVFQGVQKAELNLERAANLFPKEPRPDHLRNPRPSKTRKT